MKNLENKTFKSQKSVSAFLLWENRLRPFYLLLDVIRGGGGGGGESPHIFNRCFKTCVPQVKKT